MPFIIAEIGVNHDGELGKALEMTRVAKSCGVDAVKFQTYDAKRLEPPGERRDMLARLQLSRDDFRRLKDQCDMIGVEFMSTPFSKDDLDFLLGLGMERIKIASGQWQNVPLMDAALATGLPVYLSTGMSHGKGIFGSRATAGAEIDVTLMHCASSYPTAPEDAGLGFFREMYGPCPFPLGYSDHTLGDVAAVCAVAWGAVVIEKHFTLRQTDAGPDHHMSATPRQLRRLVKRCRAAAVMMGPPGYGVMDCEEYVAKINEERMAWRS